MKQMSFYDMKPKEFWPDYPEWEDCFKTCKNAGPWDFFPGTRKRRCLHSIGKEFICRDGIHSEFHMWCPDYEEEDE